MIHWTFPHKACEGKKYHHNLTLFSLSAWELSGYKTLSLSERVYCDTQWCYAGQIFVYIEAPGNHCNAARLMKILFVITEEEKNPFHLYWSPKQIISSQSRLILCSDLIL